MLQSHRSYLVRLVSGLTSEDEVRAVLWDDIHSASAMVLKAFLPSLARSVGTKCWMTDDTSHAAHV